MAFDRTNQTTFARWWRTVDHFALFTLIALIALGSIMVTAASPAVAMRIGKDPFYFIHRHELFLLLALVVMIGVSLLPPVYVRRLAVLGFLVSIALMALLPVIGTEIKGAKRWINLIGVSIQPSEFMKPCFAVVIAWVCASKHRHIHFPANKIVIGLYILVVGLLAMQPDFGMIVTVSVMWAVQFFVAGLSFIWVLGLGVLGVFGAWGAYHFFPHVAKRVDTFLDPNSNDNYQVAKSLEAFKSGGIFGRGPGEGEVKKFIPDSHTDFVFSVAGEEFGVIACLIIMLLFAAVVLRGFRRVWDEPDLFVLLAVTGLMTQFGIQSVINMGVAVNLLPAKGMTLPFISYGGSSVVAIALGMGMMLALTRTRYGRQV